VVAGAAVGVAVDEVKRLNKIAVDYDGLKMRRKGRDARCAYGDGTQNFG
jgi:hypothetical protein